MRKGASPNFSDVDLEVVGADVAAMIVTTGMNVTTDGKLRTIVAGNYLDRSVRERWTVARRELLPGAAFA
jgi:hypothetical protein